MCAKDLSLQAMLIPDAKGEVDIFFTNSTVVPENVDVDVEDEKHPQLLHIRGAHRRDR